METVIKLNDWHIPYHCPQALTASFKLCKHLKPKIVIIDEVNDFYAVSRFDKDARRKTQLQEDRKSVV